MSTGTIRRYATLFLSALMLGAPSTQAQESWPDLSSPPKAAGGGERDAAVIVGAENYTYVEHVVGAKKNANDWQAYLTGTLKVPADRVALLLDDDATNDAIRLAAVEKASQVEAGGTLWFVFIGHGAPSKDGKDGLLVGVDAQQKAASLYSRSFSRNELLGILDKGKQAKTVVLLDACFSGKSSSGLALVAGLQPLITMTAMPRGIDSRTILMTAARSDQFAGPLPGGARPAFSYLSLGALRGWAANEQGQVTAAGLVDYIRRALSLSRDRTQTPELSTPETGALVLGKGREAGPDLAKLQRATAASSGSGFAVTSLPAIPKAQAPQALAPDSIAGLDFRNLNIEVLKKKSETIKLDKGAGSAEYKAEAWRQLALDVPEFADRANERAAEWDSFAAQQKAVIDAKQKRIEARDADWGKLAELLKLDEAVVPQASKTNWSGEFLKAYMSSPGLTQVMTKALTAHAAVGALKTPAPTAPKDEEPSIPPAQESMGKAGIKWVRIPGGKFNMGGERSLPRHEVTVATFQMSKTLVTNKQYKACITAGRCTAPGRYNQELQGDDKPVEDVDWNQAVSFSMWAGGRLPTEAEWEYAARSGGKDQKYPWGNDPMTCAHAVIEGCGITTIEPVCSRPAGNTQQGLCDMLSSLRQWVQDSYHDTYEGAPIDGSAWEDAGSERVVRGNRWGQHSIWSGSANRSHSEPDDRFVGFRIAR